MTKLDYDVETIEERLAIVNKVLSEDPEPNERYLEAMADYLIRPIDKAEKLEQKKKIISNNRRETVSKHEISYEGLASSLESGEDGIYNLIGDPQRRTKMNTKRPISQQDIDDIPPLKQLREDIDFWLRQGSRATGRRAYKIRQFVIDMRKFQYIIRDSYKPVISFSNITPSRTICKINDKFNINAENNIKYSGVSLCNYKVCSAILCDYSRLKQEGWDNLEGDL